ncbi:DUF5682 family protein [Dactylosporangium sp. NBC_01737]|uniref:DUF5682 family protein n=1 Tax=Dactylosporangium sp. NBC_01737 TaxID=2975959 RepID=UPI002E12ACD7|nr:DUF5682 family protein [Dactylosporangium sp. NBC_01737]
MTTTFIGVRHHSPACARLVAGTIAALRPAHVLVEGPADMNDRVGELLLGHDLPVAVFSSYRDDERQSGSWAPFCAYSPEWVALQEGHCVGARVRFIDLPSWDPALAERENRYADAEQRYADVVDRLCAAFAVDNVDALWDHLFEIPDEDGLAERLAAYFDLLRGETPASEGDERREAYMARWIRAAAADAGERPVVVVTGGFHRPALIRLTSGAAKDTGDAGWPDVPALPEDAVGGSYLVPYSFRRLDAFDGYQSGMPSPEYYQQLWEGGPQHAADRLVGAVVGRLRGRKQRASTADLIAAGASAAGLALVRGHRHPGRTDILDGLAGALVHDALDEPLPWATRGRLRAGTHPVVVEMVAALSGSRVGRLHPSTPLPPLVHAADADLEREGLSGDRTVTLALTSDDGLRRSRLLHRLRVLGIPGFNRQRGPRTGVDPVLDEQWDVTVHEHRLVALIEAGAYGATLEEAAAAALAGRIRDADVAGLADALFDAALCGTVRLSDQVLHDLDAAVGTAADLGALGRLLAVVLTLWRHDRLLGTAGSAPLGTVIAAAQQRALWLAEGVRGGTAPAEPARIDAVVAVRNTMVHAGRRLGLDPQVALAVMRRIAEDRDAPPDLRGAAFGFGWSAGTTTGVTEAGAAAGAAGAGDGTVHAGAAGLAGGAGPAGAGGAAGAGDGTVHAGAADPAGAGGSAGGGSAGGEVADDPVRAVRGAAAPGTVGDWLAGLFAVAREEVLHAPRVLDVLDELVSGMGEAEFLIALPALRQAFTYFPPRERETVAGHLLARRGLSGTGRSLLRSHGVDPVLVAAAADLEARVDAVLIREGLLT